MATARRSDLLGAANFKGSSNARASAGVEFLLLNDVAKSYGTTPYGLKYPPHTVAGYFSQISRQIQVKKKPPV